MSESAVGITYEAAYCYGLRQFTDYRCLDLANPELFFWLISIALIIVLAAIVYSIGQITGAETRARASVWATAMIVGALVGFAIYLVVPPVIKALVGSGAGSLSALTGTGSDPCNF